MHATGPNGPFEMNGMGFTRLREGRACEDYVFFDSAQFAALLGGTPSGA